jgi:hypothetical protein
VDLGGFADPDGLPEAAWMELDSSHLFVQIQRVDRLVTHTTVPPALLAVVDVTTNELVDVDPSQPGVQGIELLGPIPGYKMQRDALMRRLFVSTPGVLLDGTGGIEEIDLDALTNLGFVLSEAEFFMDLGPHAIVSADRGYVVGHTDFALSSHFVAFSIPSGIFLGEFHISFTFVESIAYDETGGVVFFPDPEPQASGVLAFDAPTGAKLGGPISTGLPPVDLVVVRSPATSVHVATDPAPLRLIAAPNPTIGGVRLLFRAPLTGTIEGAVYDVRGRLVRRLGKMSVWQQQDAVLRWNGRNEGERPVPAGVYVLRVVGPGFTSSVKVNQAH